MKTAIKLILIYLLMQVLGALLAAPIGLVYTYIVEGRIEMSGDNPLIMGLAMLFGFLLMGVYLWKKGYLKNDGQLYSPVSPAYLGWSLVAGASTVFLIDFVMSGLSFVPDWLESTFNILQSNLLGIACITLLGPILEELLFRGAITKVLLNKYSPVTAILLSGFIFGLYHVNPVQVVGGCLSGFLFAWLYYRTKSLVPGILIHILNNAFSVYTGLKYPDMDSIRQLLGEQVYPICLGAAVALLILSLKMLNNYKISDINTATEL